MDGQFEVSCMLTDKLFYSFDMAHCVHWAGFRQLAGSDLGGGRDGPDTARADEVRLRGKQLFFFTLKLKMRMITFCVSVQGQPPDVSKIQESEIVGVTGILVTCSYANQEFFRVGYYVNNYYEDPEMAENPPERPIIEKLTRHILVEKPRVTKFQIQWEDPSVMMMQGGTDLMQQQQQMAEEGCLQPGSQFKDRNDMMSSANLQAAAGFFTGGAPQ